ncbi:MAG: carbamoyl phosphate synthase small subunit, partial [Gemmatimonadetes bacterium]|nr:carbamoyl phosphate synthase small subunit [Gemmatimonadota bacterium]
AMRGAIASGGASTGELLERVLAHPRMEGLELACGVSTDRPYSVEAVGEEVYHVVAFDFGVKASSPRLLSERGCRVTVLPARSGTAEVLQLEPDGVFLSNGPGDPAAVERAAGTIREVASRGIPVFGICLGHQLIARAFGGETFKLPFGHHGGNHPVMNHERKTVEITSQNHGFAVRAGGGREVAGAPDLKVTHSNLYDGTVAGVAHTTLPVIAVQYHPEAAPGPHDSSYLFD